MSRLAAAAGLGLVAGLLLGSCGPPEPPANVVVVLVDTLRAQNLSTYGYARETSPHLSAFASESLLFEDAWAQAPCTYPSVNSLLTGRDGTAFWIQEGTRVGIPEAIPSMVEILDERGYATLAFSASPIVRKTPSEHNHFGGFDRGFDVFDERCLWDDASCVNERALEYLDVVREPFFLYLHYMDPHDPYRPPEARWSTEPYQGKSFIEEGDPNPIIDLLALRRKNPAASAMPFEIDERDAAHLVNLYDDEIAYWDGRFGELHEALRERGLLDRTVVAVVADHGEELLEHGHVKHCGTLFDTEIRTPFLLRLPGVEGGRRFTAPVQNLDLVPTLLEYLEIETEGLRLDGRSLRPLLENGEDGEAVHEHVFSAWGSLRAVRSGSYKLMMDLATKRVVLYDLERDPGETRDLSAERPREVRRLQLALSRWIREVEEVADETEALRRGQEAADRLRALGYVR